MGKVEVGGECDVEEKKLSQRIAWTPWESAEDSNSCFTLVMIKGTLDSLCLES